MRLIHHTKNGETVSAILQNGFAYVANRRLLCEELLEQHDFSQREPQQFGMISFRSYDGLLLSQHIDRFGGYGICVTEQWARGNFAQKVLYLDRSGPVFEAMRELFVSAYQEVKKIVGVYPDDRARAMAYHNKAMATALGAVHYANLLQLYEYFEPVENQYQNEWRICNPDANYGISENITDAIADVSPPKGWAQFLNVRKVQPTDVDHLICPQGESNSLRSLLPEKFRNLEIIESTTERDAPADR